MKIKTIKYPDLNQNSLAWINSRPNEKANFKWCEIIGLDLPVNEFSNVNLFIESTILEREIFATIRNHVMWAQTSRIQNVLEFEISEFAPKSLFDYYESTRNEMKILSKTTRQDDYRLLLPIFSLTKYSISISIRNLIKIAMYFEYLSNECTPSDLFSSSSSSIWLLLSSFGIKQRDVSSYKLHKILNEDEINFSDCVKENNGILISSARIPFHLRAQLVRHRGIGIKDNLFDLICNNEIFTSNLSDQIDVISYGEKSVFDEIFSKRNCWIANYKTWSKYLNSINETSNIISLPCANSCPFDSDAKLRFNGSDPNPPCPIHCFENKLTPSKKQLCEMKKMVVDDNRCEKFWGDKIHLLEEQI